MTPPHERRNFSKIYEKMKLSKLSALVPDFNFTQYLGKPLRIRIELEYVLYRGINLQGALEKKKE